MNEEQQAQQPAHAVAMSNRDLALVLLIGGLVGLVIWGLGLILERFVFDMLLCQNGPVNQCANAANYSAGLAGVVGSVLGLVGLIRLRVYRPLLVVLAAAISLWGVVQLTWGSAWYWGVLASVIMYVLAYGLFTWIARLRQFFVALGVTLLIAAAVRLALML